MLTQFGCGISALAWFPESLSTRAGYKLEVLPGTASGTDVWELSQEILPTTAALPLLVTSVTSAQETAAGSILSREVCRAEFWISLRLLTGWALVGTALT